MMKNKSLLIVTLFLTFIGFAQNNQVLYDFDETPQTLLLNPGADYSHNAFIGVPFLSGISAHTGVTGLTAYDIFADDGRDVNDKLRDVINSLDNDDSFHLNEKIDIIHAGIRLNENDFISVGFYQEWDFVFYYPKDVADFFYEGSTTLDRQFSIDGVAAKTDLIGVFHVGISHKIDQKWTIGGRFKIYSGAANVQTRNNRGYLYTTSGNDNIYSHHLEQVDATLQTSGIIFDDYEDIDQSYYIKRIFGFQNTGFGLDMGFTHHPNEQWKITGSILDFGFIKYSDEVFNYYARGSYETEGIELQFDPDNPQDYWEEFEDDFEQSLPIDTLYTSYTSYRPLKLNASVKHSFGKPYYEDCTVSNSNDPYRNAIGMQLFWVDRPVNSQFAATLFYERRFGKVLSSKFTYTMDSYSLYNIGLGVSGKFGLVNMYLAADNLLSYQNLAKANSISFQFGLNIIID